MTNRTLYLSVSLSFRRNLLRRNWKNGRGYWSFWEWRVRELGCKSIDSFGMDKYDVLSIRTLCHSVGV
ncbi:hypothetical protein [Chryseobacterium sp. 22543]|uniref:hypothetical protein n=1 Tax=Chryseobacterium sp. 22543 TaxID=3453940 RepID=UPI003F8375B8